MTQTGTLEETILGAGVLSRAVLASSYHATFFWVAVKELQLIRKT